ncbi:MAG: Na+/H+ antiporter NhaC family protein [Hydrogenoanaerobacterium sp.]
MEAIQVGFLSLVPPIIAISLALITKEVISSLMIGILSGTLIYSLNLGLNPVVGTVETTFKLMATRIDMNILLFLALLGALVVVVTMAGGSRAYGQWAGSKLKTKRSALLATSALGGLIFIDDYFNCLTVGTVMKPVTDKYNVSRAKLAYIIDATAAPVCIIAPISSWAAAVGSNLRITGEFDSDLAAFVATIPYNLYALLSIVMLVALCVTNLDFGPMERAEIKAQQGDIGAIDTVSTGDTRVSVKGRVFDMLIPIGALIVFSILAMLYNGGFWGSDPAIAGNIAAAFGNCVAAEALVLGGFAALIVAFVLFVPRKIISFRGFMDGITEGIKSMVPADIILILAWTISGVCRDLLSTGEYVRDIVQGSNMPAALIPAIIFAIAAGLSFAMGTAWGTFGILIPIVVPVCVAIAPNLLIVSLSATLAGSVFGDHCSPISDTTILSSTGAGVNHIEHVSTQMPYALVVAACCFVGYLVAGFTNANVWLTFGSSAVLLLVTLVILHKLSAKKIAKAAQAKA